MGFFDYQCLPEEAADALDFLLIESNQVKYVRLLLLVACGQTCPAMFTLA